MANPIYTSAGSASAPSNIQAAYGRRVAADTASRSIRNRIRPRDRNREDEYREFVKTLLGRPDVDVRDFAGIHKAARQFAGFEEEKTPTDPYARTQQRAAGEFTAAGRLGRAKMARLRATRLEETAPRRQAVKEQRARRLAGQQARNVQFAKEREAAGGAIGTITTPEGVAIPERLYEQRQQEKRRPLAARGEEKTLPEEIAEKEERIRQIRAARRGAPAEGGRRTLRGDMAAPTAVQTIEREPTVSETQFFRKNPKVAGYASEDDRVVINPFWSKGKSPEAVESVRRNEQARIVMRQQNLKPTFAITPRQRAALGNYGPDDDIRQTIVGRIIGGDPSAEDVTEEQRAFAREVAGRMAAPDEQARLEADIEKLRTAPARTPGARRPGETPTIQAHEYMTQTYPLMQKQERLEANANRLGNAYMRATDPEEKKRLRTAWQRAERASQAMAQRVQAGPQAPGAVELGEEQGRFQRERVAQEPAYRAMEQRMVGASGEAVEATRGQQTIERARRAVTAGEARKERGITLKPAAVSAAAKLSREKWEHEKRTRLEKPVQARLDSLEKKINPPVDPMFGPLELTEEQKTQREKDIKDYERILRRLEAARKISPGTADMLVGEVVLTDEEQAELEKRRKASANTTTRT